MLDMRVEASAAVRVGLERRRLLVWYTVGYARYCPIVAPWYVDEMIHYSCWLTAVLQSDAHT